ncbi:YhjD/YihY/BrkB family envelope integrity protein [Corynebacterium auris]|uniref:YhjD/YihY/BrkB family envelope integrity protein n=1 Tax=Corynebacterium auris TaxID=44750 RepID=UPI0025B5E42B|nr:YhjD/YihY/BrkB family envelope integrity protein [Corynebacterium auris]WJY67432.1 Inner membrane protein YhjD [Corynebacterium auris]
MATATSPYEAYTDEQGIERSRKPEKASDSDIAQRVPLAARLMRMNERFVAQGGNQLAAGITYFSVLAIFPLTMLLFAGLGFFLAARPDILQQVQQQILDSAEGDVGEALAGLVESAIDQRGAVAGIGLLTTLWSGLSWMNHLRIGISGMWKIGGDEGGNFVKKKLGDLVGLLVLIALLLLAFTVTGVGASRFTSDLMDWLGVGDFPGARFVVWLVGFAVGLVANFLVMSWLNIFMPRTSVPRKSGLQGALIGAVIFELIKQFATLIVSSAANNPAGAIFGPIIALMVVLYLIWRVVLYVAAWTATTPESLAAQPAEVPEPAVINVRAAAAGQGLSKKDRNGALLGIGAAVGAVGAGVISLLTRD